MRMIYQDRFEFDDDISRIDFERVQTWLTKTYWSPGIGLEEIIKGARNSTMVVGCYLDGIQVGYMRLVSDKTRFGYLMDVYVTEDQRKQGIAQNMVRFAMETPALKDVYTWLLGTWDAQSVYAKIGFTPLPIPERWMILKKEKSWP